MPIVGISHPPTISSGIGIVSMFVSLLFFSTVSLISVLTVLDKVKLLSVSKFTFTFTTFDIFSARWLSGCISTTIFLFVCVSFKVLLLETDTCFSFNFCQFYLLLHSGSFSYFLCLASTEWCSLWKLVWCLSFKFEFSKLSKVLTVK